MGECGCSRPKPDGRGKCVACGGFACEYADPGHTRCPSSICDCFIETHPEDPFGLHPEDFLVNGHRFDFDGHMTGRGCPGCEPL